MSMHYYSRARFIFQLLPLLQSSTLSSHVVSVYAAGNEAKLISDDLSLRKPGNYNFANARSHCTFMTTEFFEQLASQNRGKLSLVNIFPGLIITPAFSSPDYPTWFKIVWFIASPLAKMMALAPEEAGHRVLFMATDMFPAKSAGRSESCSAEVATGTDGTVGSGAYACNNDGEQTPGIKRAKAYKGVQREKFSKAVWAHTMKAFDAAAAGRVFTE